MESLKVECSHCCYKWVTTSKLQYVTCPSCKHSTLNTSIKVQVIDINGVTFPLRCKKCLEGQHYLSYRCTDCNLIKFEGFK